VKKAIKEFKMFKPSDRVLVCVSGGKDSLSLWHALTVLGHPADGLYIDLGIGSYSEKSKEMAEKMANTLGRRLIIVEFGREYAPVNVVAKRARRSECSACGTIKRYYFNRIALEEGYDVVATGHNLDDEAARLLGNILRWHIPFIAKQSPVLEEENELKKKVKPLCRLTEQEIAAYAFLNRIEYIRDECPMSENSTSLLYKRALNLIEAESPGTKHFFYLEFLKQKNIFSTPLREDVEVGLKKCKVCGSISQADTCSFCRLVSYLQPLKA
jgi:uncharacterized protein (TIGR00269 family)